MIEKIKKNIVQGKYREASILCGKIDDISVSDIILNIAYDIESMAVYSFIQYMINITEKKTWIELAIDIMIHPLCFIEGAYSVALYHVRELLLMDRSIRTR